MQPVHATAQPTVSSVFRRHRRRMAGAYLLTAVENAVRLGSPLALGLSINGLVAGRWETIFWFAGQQLAHALSLAARRFWAARVFPRLGAEVATASAREQAEHGVGVSEIAARSAMARETVQFLETGVPKAFEAAFTAIGSLALLGVYDPVLLVPALGVMVMAVVLNRWYAGRCLPLIRLLNDELEREVFALNAGGPDVARGHYTRAAAVRTRISDAETVNLLLAEAGFLGLLSLCLYRVCTPATGIGGMQALFRYAVLFVTAVDRLPELLVCVIRARDAFSRIASGPRRR